MARITVILCLAVLMPMINGESEKCNKYCCFPEVFTSYIGAYSGQPSDPIVKISDTEQMLVFDYPKRIWSYRFRRIRETGEYEELLWIENFQERRRYAVRNHKCYYQDLNEKMKVPCVPNNATITQKDYLGSPFFGIQTETYNYTYKDWAIMTTFNPESCTPISDVTVYRYNQWSWSKATLEYLDQEFTVDPEFYNVERFDCHTEEALPERDSDEKMEINIVIQPSPPPSSLLHV